MENVAKNCDYVIVTLPYNKETEKIIGKKIIDLMKPTAVLVNMARGGG
jgi:lactate dehydrogenase-like 2-hydroxyacid dehydrogenase